MRPLGTFSGGHRGHFFVIFLALLLSWPILKLRTSSRSRPANYATIVDKCRSLRLPVGPPPTFHDRPQSDRFVAGTYPTLIQNATIWTGEHNGTQVLLGDILLDKGMILDVGEIRPDILQRYGNELEVLNAQGRWVSPGIVDLHSHMGDDPSPALSGSSDGNSLNGIAQPWLRSIDGINTHDDSYLLSVSGGLTTALILPGSANAIGGQAYVVKLRKTAERSTSAMILEPPHQIDSSSSSEAFVRWRHIKHACGENPSRVYGGTRMDTFWAFRQSYDKAAQLKKQQDDFCLKVENGQFDDLGEFPDDLQWEALVDVLRGRVKVNTHCYEAVDLDAFVRLTNEFKFPVAAFHHAHETYLVPEVLKRTYGGPPVSALFSGFSRYKRESYRFSEYAGKILTENGLKVAMKSDHPAINSRYLLYEAQQAYYHGMPENVAIASVTCTPAEAMGMGHRIGYVKKGWDADLVIWDSHPMALGTTPIQVFIDGIAQLESPAVAEKPEKLQHAPKIPNLDEEAREALKYDGLPPLLPRASSDHVIFKNVKDVFVRSSSGPGVKKVFSAPQLDSENGLRTVVVRNGIPVYIGLYETCHTFLNDSEPTIVDLKGGSISPALVFYGSPLGLQHISMESSTTDGLVSDPLRSDAPSILGNGTLVRAVDGLLYGSRDALMAYRAGVTTSITAPEHGSLFFFGLGTCFSTGAMHKLEPGALPQAVTALHTVVTSNTVASVSTQIAALRRLLLHELDNFDNSALRDAVEEVTAGRIPLVVEVGSADAIATLISLKKETESIHGNPIRLTIAGAAESHLLARELAEANVGVVVGPIHPFPDTWETRRILPGPPLTKDTTITKLVDHGVTVGISTAGFSINAPPGNWNAQNLRLYAAWASLDSDGKISEEQAIAMASTNLEILLGVSGRAEDADLVATEGGGLLDPSSRVVSILSPRSRKVDLL
ncbi:composite domain of metallo-dependent hydrolase [Rhodocollybia butyracea]|uniref:Composite domain of metallo-dependent hydrolase n=1 Tax=Rhodocollybia butyracea TaxID=206335 RepID=A0A9P5U8C5_9AGAR|nr:composite domain of metallo-dependent hydrolase [Rhodocollybia butyracea]